MFPAAQKFPELIPLVEELLSDHAALREAFARAEVGEMTATNLRDFGQHMSAHIRKEERQLFERIQELMSREELALLGRKLEEALNQAVQACIVPADATRLRPTK